MKIECLDGNKMYCFQWDYIDSNMYIILEKKEAFIVDPVVTEEIKAFWAKQDVTKILIILTHEHFDHINGLNWLRGNFECEVIANEICASNIESESKNLSNMAEVIVLFNENIRERKIKILPFKSWADVRFCNTKKIKWQSHNIILFTTPGHTDGSICILLDEKYLFTGDTLLNIPTVTRLPGGNKKKFEQITLPLLKNMESKILKVYPGHGDFGMIHEMLTKYS